MDGEKMPSLFRSLLNVHTQMEMNRQLVSQAF
jgi:hypothetical protein